jgi:hypothetical protein
MYNYITLILPVLYRAQTYNYTSPVRINILTKFNYVKLIRDF